MTFRNIDAHKAGPADDGLSVLAADERGPDHSHHVYYIAGLDTTRRPHLEAEMDYQRASAVQFFTDTPSERLRFVTIPFQSGSPAEHGINGVTIESLLAVCADRLEGLQGGPFASADNATALTNIKAAINTLHGRTRRRIAEGTAGTQTP